MTVACRSNAGMTIHGGERCEARDIARASSVTRTGLGKEGKTGQRRRSEREENSIAHANIEAQIENGGERERRIEIDRQKS